jgi:hypothetical protein
MDTNGRAKTIEKRRGATHAEINRGDDRAVARESGRCLDHIVGHNENVVRLEVSVDDSLQRTQPRACISARIEGRTLPVPCCNKRGAPQNAVSTTESAARRASQTEAQQQQVSATYT